MNEIKFLAFTDLHDGNLFYSNAINRLTEIKDQAEKEKVDMVLQCGDLSHDLSPDSDIVNLCKSFSMPMLHAVGNHDCDGSALQKILDTYKIDKPYYYTDINGFRFIAYDTNQMYHHGKLVHFELGNNYWQPRGIRDNETFMYALGKEQINWLEKTIMESPYPCILFGHHSLVRPKTGLVAEERKLIEEMMDRVNKENQRIMLVICGHYHVDYLYFQNNIPYFELNSATNFYFDDCCHSEFGEEIHKNYPETCHNVIWEKPLYAIITLKDDGTVDIKGMECDYFCGVTPYKLSMSDIEIESRIIAPKVSSHSFKLNLDNKD